MLENGFQMNFFLYFCYYLINKITICQVILNKVKDLPNGNKLHSIKEISISNSSKKHLYNFKFMNKSKIKHLLSTGLLKISDLLEMIDTLNRGGCAIMPTDTGYLMACDATNDVAIQNVFTIKKRRNSNPIHVCVGSVNQAYKVGKFSIKAERLLDTYCPGAISIIVPKQEWVSDLLIANTGNIGIRIPNEPCIMQICNELNKPITATSVNLAEQPPLSDFSEILNLFGKDVDYLVQSNKDVFLDSSTVVRIVNDTIEILRKGPIPDNLIFETANNTTTYSDYRERI